MAILPLKELICPKKVRPEAVLSLIKAMEMPEATVETYIFTPSIRENLQAILEAVAQEKGGGFWIQAEYGAGKTHLLALLGCLLTSEKENLWDKVSDEEITFFRKCLRGMKPLFPIVVSMRGKGGEPSLLGILEAPIKDKLEDLNLQDRISVTSTDEWLAWFEGASSGLREAISEFVKTRQGMPAEEYRASMGATALAQEMSAYFKENVLPPPIPTSTEKKTDHIYKQLLQVGFGGMLFIIDEFAFWQDHRPEGSPQAAQDEEVLETLAWLLPQDYGHKIFVVVASQKPPPAKLRGARGEESARFRTMLLLAKRDERDYDIIVSGRVRDLVEDHLPETRQYYDLYYQNFAFLKNTSREIFEKIFPFQPRCFEIMQRITARELPTARVGINVIYETITDGVDGNTGHLLDERRLLVASDLMKSPSLADAFNTTVYGSSYQSYIAAVDDLSDLELAEDQLERARQVLDTLFLMHLAYLETGKPLSLQELVEATLTFDGVVKKEDEIGVILSKLQTLPQIDYSKERGATFKPTDAGKRNWAREFAKEKAKVTEEHRPEVEKCWERGLVLSSEETGGQKSLFGDLALEESRSEKAEFRRIQYSGQVILASSWKPDLGDRITKENVHFRIVLLTRLQEVTPTALLDPRIVVCIPAELKGETWDVARDYTTLLRMEEKYKDDDTSEGVDARGWLSSEKRPKVIRELLGRQSGIYRAGTIITQKAVAIDAKAVFVAPNASKRHSLITEALLSSAYTSLTELIGDRAFKGTFDPKDAKKVFDGFLKQDAGHAARSALDNFAVGLMLAKSDAPRKLDPEHSAAFTLLRERLEKEEGRLPVWELYRDLTREPYGLTVNLMTLNLLLFVRYGNPSVILELKPDHTLTLSTGQRPYRDQINAHNVLELDWRGRPGQAFQALVRGVGPSWNDILPWAQAVLPDLRVASNQTETETQEQALLKALAALKMELPTVRTNLGVLGSVLAGALNDEQKGVLDLTETLFEAKGYREYYDLATESCEGEIEHFKDRVARYRKLKSAADAAAEIGNIKSYLDGAVIPETESALAVSHMTLTNQLSLSSLLSNPQIIGSIRDQFSKFQDQYENAYQRHHRDLREKKGTLYEDLKELGDKLTALRCLNAIEELGRPMGEQLKEEYPNLLKASEPCPAADLVSVKDHPLCDWCKITLETQPPEEDVRRFERELEKAFRDRAKALSAALTREILASDQGNRLETLIKVLHVSRLDSLPNVLTDELVSYIRDLLHRANVKTIESPIFRKVGEAFPALEEAQISQVVEAFERSLKEAFERAKREHPNDVKIRISLR